ncbi:MAG: 2-C-methyl-D-erythritol 4-phosphate cytidylyltransferase [Chitinophagaceae bacterium]|nr:MAG: 2-C-methyl-D-erythritol 4-phosphate cytidylyltransferase [Chitinophagaceae bacterium]
MKKKVIIVAGGNGSRMGASMPKQFLMLKNKPILYYSIKAFLDAFDDIEIVLVLPEEYLGLGQEIVDAYFDADKIQITMGGETRFHSVKNGLQFIDEECIVMVHDAVRCMVTPKLIQELYDEAVFSGAVIPVVSATDSIRIVTEKGSETLDRNIVKIVQTPQAFYSKILLPAFNIDYKEKFTDEASVVEAFGVTVHLIDGDINNIKITTPKDLIIAESTMV